MKNPEAQTYKAHISIKQQNLGSSQGQPNPEHTLSNTRVVPIYPNNVPAKWPFSVSGKTFLAVFPMPGMAMLRKSSSHVRENGNVLLRLCTPMCS